MSPRVKYWYFLLAVVLITFTVIIGSMVGSWESLTSDEKIYISHLVGKLLPFPLLGAAILCLLIGTLISLLFKYYIIPILQLGEETRLLSTSNLDYRLKPRGAKELVQLAKVINESADSFQRMQQDIDQHIALSKAHIKEERNRLAALMTEIPHAVLVCNQKGRILLYNPKAEALFNTTLGEEETDASSGIIGLGRSVFSLLDPDLLNHALAMLESAVQRGEEDPVSSFMLSHQGGAYLRVNMAAVLVVQNDEPSAANGFVITLEDMTRQIAADTRRDSLIRSLTDDLQNALGEIRQSITEILSTPEMGREHLQEHRNTIDQASQRLEIKLQQARRNYASHLREQSKVEEIPGESILEVVARNISDRFECKVRYQSDPDLWLRLDSYSFVQTLAQLTGTIIDHADNREFTLHLKDHNGYNRLEILWKKLVPEHLINEWRDTPLMRGNRGTTFSFAELLEKMNGRISYLAGATSGHYRGIHVDYPKPETSVSKEKKPQGNRPVCYEFNLFEQISDTEMAQTPLSKLTFVVFDTETTGLNPSEGDEIIQLGAVRIINGQILHNETIDQLVDPRRHVPASSVAIHGIDPKRLRGQPTIDKVLPHFHDFAEGAVLVAHNAAFDMRFLQIKEKVAKRVFNNPVLDTLLLSSIIHPNLQGHALEGITERLNIQIIDRHTALGDALVTAEVLIKLIPLLEAEGIITLDDALKASKRSKFAKISY